MYGFVSDKPQWNSTDVPSVLFRTKGKKAVLSCAAHAYPSPVFRWFFGDTNLKSEESQLIVHDEGIYRCEVANSRGAIARNFTVFVSNFILKLFHQIINIISGRIPAGSAGQAESQKHNREHRNFRFYPTEAVETPQYHRLQYRTARQT